MTEEAAAGTPEESMNHSNRSTHSKSPENSDHRTSSGVQKIDLSTFFISISSAVFMGLGLIPLPGKEELEINLELASQNLQLLELMFEKTKGNRTPQEEQLIQKLLTESQVQFEKKMQSLALTQSR